jgi:hypothetical protein
MAMANDRCVDECAAAGGISRDAAQGLLRLADERAERLARERGLSAPEADRGRARSSLCAQQACFAERTGQKACPRLDRGSFSSVSSPILGSSPSTSLGVQHPQVHCWGRLRSAAPEQSGGTVKQLRLARRDLVRMNVVLPRQFGQRLLTLDGSQCHPRVKPEGSLFALKAGLWVRRARLAIVAPDLRHSRRSQAETPLIDLSEFGQPPLPSTSNPLPSTANGTTPSPQGNRMDDAVIRAQALSATRLARGAWRHGSINLTLPSSVAHGYNAPLSEGSRGEWSVGRLRLAGGI